MTKLLVMAAAMGLTVSVAGACEFMRSAQAKNLDQTVVASIAGEQATPMSTSQQIVLPPAGGTVIVEPKAE